MFMTTENSQKSKKYVVTKLFAPGETPLGQLVEKQLCRCDTLEECAKFILDNNEYWYNCRYGKQDLRQELCDLIIKIRNLQKRSNSLESDFS